MSSMSLTSPASSYLLRAGEQIDMGLNTELGSVNEDGKPNYPGPLVHLAPMQPSLATHLLSMRHAAWRGTKAGAGWTVPCRTKTITAGVRLRLGAVMLIHRAHSDSLRLGQTRLGDALELCPNDASSQIGARELKACPKRNRAAASPSPSPC